MAKRIGKVLERIARSSKPAGAAQEYHITDELRRMLGSGDVVEFHTKVWGMDTGARITLTLYQGSVKGLFPRDEGLTVATVGTTVMTAAGSYLLSTSGDFMGELELVVKVDQISPTVLVWTDFEIWATVITKGA